MSVGTIEDILFKLQDDPTFRTMFIADAPAAIAEFPLTEVERKAVISLDVHTMSAVGVSNMLLMTSFMAVNGPQAIPDYLRRMNTVPSPQ